MFEFLMYASCLFLGTVAVIAWLTHVYDEMGRRAEAQSERHQPDALDETWRTIIKD